MSSDLTSVHYISTSRMCYGCVICMCNAVDNSLVVWNQYKAADVVVVPPNLLSLSLHCVSTIILYKNELPISLLPPRLYKLNKLNIGIIINKLCNYIVSIPLIIMLITCWVISMFYILKSMYTELIKNGH